MISTGPRAGASWEGSTVAAAGAAAAAAAPSNSGGGVGGGGNSGLLLAMAMAAGGPGDGVLTRDASMIEDYILLMSDEAVAEDEAEGMAGQDLMADAPFRRQVKNIILGRFFFAPHVCMRTKRSMFSYWVYLTGGTA